MTCGCTRCSGSSAPISGSSNPRRSKARTPPTPPAPRGRRARKRQASGHKKRKAPATMAGAFLLFSFLREERLRGAAAGQQAQGADAEQAQGRGLGDDALAEIVVVHGDGAGVAGGGDRQRLQHAKGARELAVAREGGDGLGGDVEREGRPLVGRDGLADGAGADAAL